MNRKFSFSSLIFSFLLLFVFIVFSGCAKKGKIELYESHAAEINPDTEWAVVTSPYAALRKEPNLSSETESVARKGDIFIVSGRRTIPIPTEGKMKSHSSIWYKRLEGGWVEGSLVEVYDTRLKAESIAEK